MNLELNWGVALNGCSWLSIPKRDLMNLELLLDGLISPFPELSIPKRDLMNLERSNSEKFVRRRNSFQSLKGI